MKTIIIGLLLISIPSRGYCQDDAGNKKSAAINKKPADSKSQDNIQYLDMSKPDKPASEFPEITKKGSL